MQIDKTVAGTVYILRLSGRFDAHEVEPVQQNLAKSGSQIIVNLGSVHFIDSTALAVLVKAMKRARHDGGDLVLCDLRKPVRVIFELTRLDRAFVIVDDEAAAIEAYNSA